jgi:hypothetical protein
MGTKTEPNATDEINIAAQPTISSFEAISFIFGLYLQIE